ncbi:hypothetical protein TTHERM_00572050 (macronuclear) [Tetrahymena thermophila SB210]|uniref:Uncharacterized protein n=1 Tax=Tetrahymena thermophila (strain SB210) TaxID=312017 RepID=Q24HW9_TETTS|nr:hypothetical protein TTHERM_00572050 [Tetrahymena thermophila SB210]EAS07469.2 hypothetical protein TTHERM_00572050 [Tetrahymena thermophila SB210]|eukprot:XP_001027711.2 hypothetical protein TTHERM_00572050 [Tetrahymena thermophila SB210]
MSNNQIYAQILSLQNIFNLKFEACKEPRLNEIQDQGNILLEETMSNLINLKSLQLNLDGNQIEDRKNRNTRTYKCTQNTTQNLNLIINIFIFILFQVRCYNSFKLKTEVQFRFAKYYIGTKHQRTQICSFGKIKWGTDRQRVLLKVLIVVLIWQDQLQKHLQIYLEKKVHFQLVKHQVVVVER